MKTLKLFLLVIFVGLLGTIPSQAEKFPSSLRQDIGSSVNDQTVALVPALPAQASGEKMPQATSSSFPEAPTAAPVTSRAPSTETNGPLLSDPSSIIPKIPSQSSSFNKQITPNLKNPFDVKSPKISSPDFEAQFKKLQQQQQEEEKPKKKKKLSESIRDELRNYGLFFLLGLAAILLIYALRKEAPATKPHVEQPKELIGKPRDIWKEDF